MFPAGLETPGEDPYRGLFPSPPLFDRMPTYRTQGKRSLNFLSAASIFLILIGPPAFAEQIQLVAQKGMVSYASKSPGMPAHYRTWLGNHEEQGKLLIGRSNTLVAASMVLVSNNGRKAAIKLNLYEDSARFPVTRDIKQHKRDDRLYSKSIAMLVDGQAVPIGAGYREEVLRFSRRLSSASTLPWANTIIIAVEARVLESAKESVEISGEGISFRILPIDAIKKMVRKNKELGLLQ